MGARALASAKALWRFASVSPTWPPTTSGPLRLCAQKSRVQGIDWVKRD